MFTVAFEPLNGPSLTQEIVVHKRLAIRKAMRPFDDPEFVGQTDVFPSIGVDSTKHTFFRQVSGDEVTEEIVDNDTHELIKTIKH